MGFNPLTNAMASLKDYGFFDTLLPMLLIFSIFYAILVKTKILGDENKGHVKAINAVISAIVAFIFVTETGLVSILNSLLPRAALLLVIAMLLLVVLGFTGMFNYKWFESPGKATYIIAGILILIFLGVLDMSGVYIPGLHQVIAVLWSGAGIGNISITGETLEIALAIIIFIAVPLLIVGAIVFSSGKSK